MKISTGNIFLYLAIVFIGVYMSACKPGDPPKLIVTVIDSAGSKVAGANIDVVSNGYVNGKPQTGIVKANATSGSDGTATFEFKLDAVLTVKASKLDANGDSLKGSTMAKLITDETTEATVTIRRGN